MERKWRTWKTTKNTWEEDGDDDHDDDDDDDDDDESTIKRPSRAFRSGGLWGAYWGFLGATMGPFRELLGPSWDPVGGGVMVPSWGAASVDALDAQQVRALCTLVLQHEVMHGGDDDDDDDDDDEEEDGGED